MVDKLVTVFVPLVGEDRMAAYAPDAFELLARALDPGVDIRFTPAQAGDEFLFMPGGGAVFFIPAGSTVAFDDGPTLTAPADRNILVAHIVKTYDWAPVLAPTGQPVAEWWAFEGVTTASFEAFVDALDLDWLAVERDYEDREDLRASILAGHASLNALVEDGNPAALGSLAAGGDGTVTLGVRAFSIQDSGPCELNARAALASLKQLAPGLAAHPLLVKVIEDVSNSPVTIHIQFVYWLPYRVDSPNEVIKGCPEPIQANSTIALQKRSAAGLYTTLAQAPVAGNGQVALTVSRPDLQSVDLAAGESLVFRVQVPARTVFGTQYQHGRLPCENDVALKWGTDSDTWVTENRSTTDEEIGSLDFLVSLESPVVGMPDQPLKYYAGVPIFLQVQYPVVSTTGAGAAVQFSQEIRKAPKGLRVVIQNGAGKELGKFHTDEHGQVWGTLMTWDPANPSVVVDVQYEIKDETIGLPVIYGEVVEHGSTFRDIYNTNEYSGKNFLEPWEASIGRPTGTAQALGLAVMQVGEVQIVNGAGSQFTSTNGRDAGLLFALQQVRYIHQWFYHLTQGFRIGGIDRSWGAALIQHDGGAGVWASNPAQPNYITAVPFVRVTEPLPAPDESRFGEVGIQPSPDGRGLAWCLILYGHDQFATNQTLGGSPLPPPNLPQFWREHTIWHEFTHAVANMALGLLLNMDTYASLNNAKNPNASSIINQPIGDGWSAFEEGFAAITEVTLLGKATGIAPGFSPSPFASPRYMQLNVDTDGDGVADLLLKDGMAFPGVQDWRLGLRVSLAFTWGFWTALQRLVAGFDTFHNLYGGPPQGNDLQDSTAYLRSPDAQRIFQALIWGPLISLATPQGFGAPPPGMPAPPQWDDLDGNQPGFTDADPQGKGAAGPPFGSPGSRRIRINGPSTHRFLELIEQQYWGSLTASEQKIIRKLFGDVDDPGNREEASYYLWFDF